MKKFVKLTITMFFLLAMVISVLAIPEQIPIPGNKAWTKLGMTIKIGDIIEITSAGEISPNGAVKCGPIGVPNRPDWQAYCVIKTSLPACLIGKISENGKPFYVGNNFKITAESSGELYLGINDTDLGNNSGKYLSIVTINKLDVSSLNSPKNIKIPGDKAWSKTGFVVKEGQYIEIFAEGQVSPNGTVKCDPNGVPNRPDWQANYCVIKTSNHACLIGKIGETGKPFFVGKKITMTSKDNGELFLGINDTDLGNNSGFYNASASYGKMR